MEIITGHGRREKGYYAGMDLRPGTRVRHFKGGEYEVVGLGRHSETDETLVVYRPLGTSPLAADQQFWVRPITMFTDEVSRDGYHGPRFVQI